MRIAFLISSLEDGGAARIVSNISSHLPADWEIDIILDNSDIISFPVRGNIVSIGMKNSKNRGAVSYHITTFLYKLRFVKRIKRSNKYDCCISYMDSANLINILTKSKNCKTIINVVNNMTALSRFENRYKYIVKPVIKLFYNHSDMIMALSEEVRSDLIVNYGLDASRIKVSYCSIDLDDIDEVIKRESPNIDREWFSSKSTVITAGRLTKQKGHWHLIRAFNKVLKSVPDAKLCIFGQGELEEYLKTLVNAYGIQNSVRFFGFDNRLDAFISCSSIFAFPSLFEGFGTALQEALACGVACVSTDYESGAREQLAPRREEKIEGICKCEYGIVTEACSDNMLRAEDPLEKEEELLADAIIELLKDEDIRKHYAKVARERSIIYDINLISKKWMMDVSECVGGCE